MSEQLKKALIDGALMWLRVTLLAAIPAILIMLSEQSVDWSVVGFTLAVASLKGLDEVLHKYGKATENTKLERGITRF